MCVCVSDMAALSAATVGVSLCDAETTVAACVVAKLRNPDAVVAVLREGRCSLITAYVLVNYNIMYATIQLFMTCLLNNQGLVFGDYMYLIQDCFFSLVLGLCIAYTRPAELLDTQLPPSRFFSPFLMAKLLVQLAIFPCVQVIALESMKNLDWYTPYATDEPLVDSASPENTVLNAISLSQLMIASVVVTIGKPFRMPFYSNYAHMSILLCQTAWICFIVFSNKNQFLVDLENDTVPHSMGGIVFGLIGMNVFLSWAGNYTAEHFFRL